VVQAELPKVLTRLRCPAHAARARDEDIGLAVRSDQYGWAIDESFLINLADAPAIGAPRRATFIKLEPDGVTWPDIGVNVQVMQSGQPTGRYHSEPAQEDFLVLLRRMPRDC